MKKMMHMHRQVTPDICKETSFAPAVFSLNKNNAVCLPVVSESQKLIRVHSDQTDLQPDGAAELDKAFDRFPYLTEKSTAALAQRCTLHPDQVKVWFMSQRHYGISWEYNDIMEVWRKVRPNLQTCMEEETYNDRRQVRQKKEADESAGKRQENAREEQSRNERKVVAENVRANEQLERKIRQGQPVNKVKGRKVDKEHKRNTQQKRKRIMAMDMMGTKKMKPFDEAALKRAGEEYIRRDQKRSQQRSVCVRKKKTQTKD